LSKVIDIYFLNEIKYRFDNIILRGKSRSSDIPPQNHSKHRFADDHGVQHICVPARHGTAHLAWLDYNSVLLFHYAALQLTLAALWLIFWLTYVFNND